MPDPSPVFLLEDDFVDALTVKRAFKQLEVSNELVHFQNGEEALVRIEENPDFIPSLLLLDLNMPRMGGFEFLEKLIKISSFKDVPIVILTTSTEKIDRAQSQKFDVMKYLIKPVDYKDFVEMIRSLFPYLSFKTRSVITPE